MAPSPENTKAPDHFGAYLFDSKERETGFGPATSTLANWLSIENKEQPRPWCSFRTTKTLGFSPLRFETRLNAVEMR